MGGRSWKLRDIVAKTTNSTECNTSVDLMQTNFQKSIDNIIFWRNVMLTWLSKITVFHACFWAVFPGILGLTPLLCCRGTFQRKLEKHRQRDFNRTYRKYISIWLVKRCHRPSFYLSMVSYPKKQERRNCMINRTFFHSLNSVAYYKKERKLMVRLIILQFKFMDFTQSCFITGTTFPNKIQLKKS